MTETANLRNEDFRKLLNAPKKPVAETSVSGDTSHSFTHRHQAKTDKKKGGGGHKHKKERLEHNEDEATLKEILKNYRDRALERRLKGNDDSDEIVKLAAAYRAMPGDARAISDKANLRRQAIEESKYLGGDMEHTHLVKGLDYSLLNKVRSEINKSQAEADTVDELEIAFDQKGVDAVEKMSENKMVRGMHRVLFKNELPLRNELFGKGRMAYVVDMEDEDSDIPTTLLRSVHDCPKAESNANINANNMLISKLTQACFALVLSYLRSDHKKKKKPDMTEEEIKKYQSQNIYDNEAEYAPKKDKERDRRDRDREQKKDRSYFDSKDDRYKRDGDRDRREKDRDRRGGREYDRRDRDRDRERERERERERDREREKERREKEEKDKEKRLEEKMEKRRREAEGGGYDECYPGGMAEMGGGWDSDEEDLTMMDMGAKKSSIKRWEFDNDDDYEKFQGAREAMPKAAYQYGVKTGDGRKTRKSADVNKKIDKELNQITKLIEKRKSGMEEERDYKRPKY